MAGQQRLTGGGQRRTDTPRIFCHLVTDTAYCIAYRTKAPPKYQFEENGETKYWSGRGRAPKPIAEALAGGRSLDEFIIKKDASSSAGDEH
nr:H-NS family nucleoid-associated regulatory protein [Escherichia coli]